MALKLVRSIEAVRKVSRQASKDGKTIALVPTMGGLHAGHLSLVKRAEAVADLVVVSLFVNPTQFNNPNDLKTYPRNEAEDLAALRETGTDVVFAPAVETVYPPEFSTSITVSTGSDILCAAHRPGHFAGVATVVCKLLLQVEPDFAIFGEKDFQQLFIIRRMVRDLDIPVEIVPCATVRDTDGLALSSRNQLLGLEGRQSAPELYRRMREASENISAGLSPVEACRRARNALEVSGSFRVEYFEYRSADTLKLSETRISNGRIFAAAALEGVRLIDNLAVK